MPYHWEGLTMFGVRETSALCEIPVPTLRDWVRKGAVQPVLWGRAGCYDDGHRFSNVQLVALAFMGWLHSYYRRNLGPQYVKELMAKAEECNEGRLARLIWGNLDSWDEEWLAMLRTLSPTLEELPESLARRVTRVVQAIRRNEEEGYLSVNERIRKRRRGRRRV
jgi:hypothetical protein